MCFDDITNLFNVKKYTYELTLSENNIPEVCRKQLLMPMHDFNGTQYLFYINLENHYVTLWSVDTTKFVKFSCSYLKQYEMKKQLMYGRINIHNLIKNNNKIYALPDFANFILCFDLFNDGFTVACESFDHIYGLSNTIYNDAIYYSKWSIHDQLKRNHADEDIELNIGRYDIKENKYKKIASVLGPDSIHQTVLTPRKDKIIAIEVPRFIANKDNELSLANSKILVYDIITKQYDVTVMDKGPAHIVFDKVDPDIGYVACCNFSAMGCFGQGRIDKYSLSDKFKHITSYESKTLWRISNHQSFQYKGEHLLATPVYPNQVHIISTDTMTIKKEIRLSLSGISPETYTIPFYYPSYDSTPYTVLPIDESPYIILCSKWSIKILDFVNNKIINTIHYNLKNFPLWTTAHSSIVL